MTVNLSVEFHDVRDVMPGNKARWCLCVMKDKTLRSGYWDPFDHGFWDSWAEDATGIGDVIAWAYSSDIKVKEAT